MQGLIVSSFGRNFIVEIANNQYNAVTRAKRTDFVVGDVVEVSLINTKQVQIQDLVPRKNLIFRSDKNRSKIIASNISQILIVIAIKPNFNINFLNSCLVFAESQNIPTSIIINKTDLLDSVEFITKIRKLYEQQLEYRLVTLSALNNCDELKPLLQNNHTLLIGQSGVGKSTITNQIIPNAFTPTNSITKSATSGKHTTTNATLYHINYNATLVDCPGLHEFGLYHLDKSHIPSFFPECRELVGRCRFRNCQHLNEPNCAIIETYNNGGIDERRFKFLTALMCTTVNYLTTKS
ncbi:MAG: ribosome small subunit-dependent GTPase A [Burkholderiales bacterium]|nr:ribosome small subunit-dependent GTPase A [Burkholderiales bacterium]